jgi:hypothetical protein
MIRMLFGMKPIRLRAASNCSVSSGVYPGGSAQTVAPVVFAGP